jgi:hypothetical protein
MVVRRRLGIGGLELLPPGGSYNPWCRAVIDALAADVQVEPVTYCEIELPHVFAIRRLRLVTHSRIKHWYAYAQGGVWKVCLGARGSGAVGRTIILL